MAVLSVALGLALGADRVQRRFLRAAPVLALFACAFGCLYAVAAIGSVV
jgi:hypothetical protein